MKFGNPKIYSLATGSLLFLIGFLGFAFRGAISLPDSYLLISLLLGFWGIIAGMAKR